MVLGGLHRDISAQVLEILTVGYLVYVHVQIGIAPVPPLGNMMFSECGIQVHESQGFFQCRTNYEMDMRVFHRKSYHAHAGPIYASGYPVHSQDLVAKIYDEILGVFPFGENVVDPFHMDEYGDTFSINKE